MTAVADFEAAQKGLLRRCGIDAESLFVDVPAIAGHAHVLRYGDGPPVVMVPGFGDPAAMWAPLMTELGGFTLYAVDRPCFGLSGCAEQTTTTFRRLAVDFLEQTLDALHLGRPLFVANSIGSLWTTWLALDRPERVAAMVHIGCPAFVLGTSAPLPMRLLSVRPLGRLLMAILQPSPRQVEGFAKNIGGVDLSGVPELRDLLVTAQKLPGVAASTRALLHAVVRLRGARPEVALTEEQLAQVRQPAVLIWGERDAFGGPGVGEGAARIMADAELEVIPGGGHVPWIDHPGEVAAAAVPFLRKHAASAA